MPVSVTRDTRATLVSLANRESLVMVVGGIIRFPDRWDGTVANPDRLNAATILTAAVADGALQFLRKTLPKDQVAPFFGMVERAVEGHLERQRLAAEQGEREQRERQRLALEERPPICYPRSCRPSNGDPSACGASSRQSRRAG